MDQRITRILAALLASAALTIAAPGCVPAIGDECKTASDCPSTAVCDSTAPGGYCTIPDCEIGTCPGPSICVEFDEANSYCMKHCESNSDCRDGYNCIHGNESRAYCYVGS